MKTQRLLSGLLALPISFLMTSISNSWAVTELPILQDTLSAKQFRIGLGGTYLKTQTNFQYNGAKEKLPSDHYFQSLSGVGFFQYGIMEKLTGFFDAKFSFNSAQGLMANSTSLLSNSRSGPSDLDLGLRYEHELQPFRFFGEATVLLPLYARPTANQWSSFNSTSETPLGNGIAELGVTATGEYPLGSENSAFSLGAGLGFTHRMSEFSSPFSYRGYLKYAEPNSFFARAGVVGQSTLLKDRFTGIEPPPTIRANTLIAGSRALNSIDPTYLKIDALLGTYFSKTYFLSAGLQYPLSGKNTFAEPVFYAAFGLEFGGDSKQTVRKTVNKRGFQEYSLTSRVIQANNSLKQFLIDRGSNHGVKLGETLDLFLPDSADGSFGETIANAKVIQVGPTRSKLELLESYKETKIQEGFVVRRPVR